MTGPIPKVTASRLKRLDFGAEAIRLLSLAAWAAWLFRRYFSPYFFGGIDGRWYGYAMTDALRQTRLGVFPVLIGQSEYMFNGSVSPLRIAPYYQYLGILLDGLTAHALPPVGVQHLTVVVTAVLSAVVCYLCLAALAPARRWLAWIVSALYVGAPAAAAFIYVNEMYMTFMAFAWLPLVFFGNVKLIRRDQFSGWAWVAVGLALVWFCHAPIGAWATLGTLCLQGLRLLARDFTWAAWRRAGAAAGLFLGLTLAYFYSVAEVSGSGGSNTGHVLVYGLAAVAALGAVVRHLATGRAWSLGLAAAAATVLWFTYPFYGLWMAGTLVPAALAGQVGRRWPAWRVRERLPEWSMAVFLAGGLLALPFPPPSGPMPALTLVAQLFPGSLLPLSRTAQALSDMQVGYGLWLAFWVGLAAAVFRPTWENRLLSLLGLMLLGLSIPLPGVTRFLLTIVPDLLYEISSSSLWLRYIPLLVALSAFLGFLGAVEWTERSPRGRIALFAIACLALAWSRWESQKFIRQGDVVINGPDEVGAFYRSENIRVYGYVIRSLPSSPYATNGIVDYHLESRLLRGDDPTREIDPGFDWSRARTVTFTTKADATAPLWLGLKPTLNLAPGERLLVRFRFFDRSYAGTLVCSGPRGFYREYFLPEAGFYSKSFGVAPERPKTLAFWNTLAEPQPVQLLFLQAELPKDGRPFGDFAEAKLLPYDPAELPVRTLGLVPYRAEATVNAPAFLETPRGFVPGYRATVNGKSAPVLPSPNHMVMVPLAAGRNSIELSYPGTRRLWLAISISFAVWLGVLAVGLGAWWRSRAVPPGDS